MIEAIHRRGTDIGDIYLLDLIKRRIDYEPHKASLDLIDPIDPIDPSASPQRRP